ncbi:hypothetical protein K432DRAFT_361331, partial [Lepidopterella palustris CBS 459.81]
MNDLGFPPDTGTSRIAFVAFSLLTSESARRIREEALNDDVGKYCEVEGKVIENQVTGMVPRAKYSTNLWAHELIRSRISRFAEIDLVPVVDYEVSHVSIIKPSGEEHNAAVQLHKDSYPYVCGVILSDMEGIKGGETVLRGPFGELRTVRPLKIGLAFVLQGYHVAHMVKPFFGPNHRITAVTSFRPRSPLEVDETHLGTVRPNCNLNRLYGGFLKYRLDMV